ncbi:MAG: hypothetical protein ACTHKV_14885 [Flavipsychrobacter sp.]
MKKNANILPLPAPDINQVDPPITEADKAFLDLLAEMFTEKIFKAARIDESCTTEPIKL